VVNELDIKWWIAGLCDIVHRDRNHIITVVSHIRWMKDYWTTDCHTVSAFDIRRIAVSHIV